MKEKRCSHLSGEKREKRGQGGLDEITTSCDEEVIQQIKMMWGTHTWARLMASRLTLQSFRQDIFIIL